MSPMAASLMNAIDDGLHPVWWPALTSILADAHPSHSGAYSTSRELASDADAKSAFITVEASSQDEMQLRIEMLEGSAAVALRTKGFELYLFHELQTNICLQTLSEALTLISRITSLGNSVQTLVKSIHLLRPEHAAIDISFSEPKLPFSIFVSVPSSRVLNDASRVAEAIIHEAMHLQLSLAERAVPLVRESEVKTFSPWRNQTRDASGLLHALYVFRVIFDWLGVPIDGHVSEYAACRRREIEQQVKRADWVEVVRGLTPAGAALVTQLLHGLTIRA